MNKVMENFFNVPLILKDYKDLIPKDYDDRDYYEGKPVEGIIFQKRYYKDSRSDNTTTFEILCYCIPHRNECMCHLTTPIHIESDDQIPKDMRDKLVALFYKIIIKDNIAGIHKGEFENELKRLSSELAKTQSAINNLIEFKEKYNKE